jgi:hypothetical protein
MGISSVLAASRAGAQAHRESVQMDPTIPYGVGS